MRRRVPKLPPRCHNAPDRQGEFHDGAGAGPGKQTDQQHHSREGARRHRGGDQRPPVPPYASDHGLGGADLVLVNNKPVSAVSVPMHELADKKITTVEGLAAADGKLHPLQQAFVDEDAIGCGYCTPGWLIASLDLLNRHPQPTDDQIDQLPNLCRCGCQTRVRRAIKRAAAAMAGGRA